MSGRILVLEDGTGTEHRVEVRDDGTAVVAGRAVNVRQMPDGSFGAASEGTTIAWGALDGSTCWVFLAGRVYTLTARQAHAGAGTARRRGGSAHHGSLAAPMPATVRRVQAAAGDRVHRGDVLLVLEAMKMEMPVRATADGTITAVNCREGEMVQAGQELIEIDED
jgi:biotin carboxyl carrier protein